MKILVIGGSGTIGSRVVTRLSSTHEVIIAGRHSGQVQVDLSDSASIQKMYQQMGALDAVVCIAGEAKWAPFETLSESDFHIGLDNKLMGQVNLVRLGHRCLNPGGSFTLTTGILADHPVPMTSSAAMVNGALHSFVKAVALELSELRVNVVSAGLVDVSVERYGEFFPDHPPVPVSRVVDTYAQSVEGQMTGQILKVYPTF